MLGKAHRDSGLISISPENCGDRSQILIDHRSLSEGVEDTAVIHHQRETDATPAFGVDIAGHGATGDRHPHVIVGQLYESSGFGVHACGGSCQGWVLKKLIHRNESAVGSQYGKRIKEILEGGFSTHGLQQVDGSGGSCESIATSAPIEKGVFGGADTQFRLQNLRFLSEGRR